MWDKIEYAFGKMWLTFLNIVIFRNIHQCEGEVALDPAEWRRRAILRTRNCNVHKGLKHRLIQGFNPGIFEYLVCSSRVWLLLCWWRFGTIFWWDSYSWPLGLQWLSHQWQTHPTEWREKNDKLICTITVKITALHNSILSVTHLFCQGRKNTFNYLKCSSDFHNKGLWCIWLIHSYKIHV